MNKNAVKAAINQAWGLFGYSTGRGLMYVSTNELLDKPFEARFYSDDVFIADHPNQLTGFLSLVDSLPDSCDICVADFWNTNNTKSNRIQVCNIRLEKLLYWATENGYKFTLEPFKSGTWPMLHVEILTEYGKVTGGFVC